MQPVEKMCIFVQNFLTTNSYLTGKLTYVPRSQNFSIDTTYNWSVLVVAKNDFVHELPICSSYGSAVMDIR